LALSRAASRCKHITQTVYQPVCSAKN
jgi:hypothetical protein